MMGTTSTDQAQADKKISKEVINPPTLLNTEPPDAKLFHKTCLCYVFLSVWLLLTFLCVANHAYLVEIYQDTLIHSILQSEMQQYHLLICAPMLQDDHKFFVRSQSQSFTSSVLWKTASKGKCSREHIGKKPTNTDLEGILILRNMETTTFSRECTTVERLPERRIRKEYIAHLSPPTVKPSLTGQLFRSCCQHMFMSISITLPTHVRSLFTLLQSQVSILIHAVGTLTLLLISFSGFWLSGQLCVPSSHRIHVTLVARLQNSHACCFPW